jgi:hypothetical protein
MWKVCQVVFEKCAVEEGGSHMRSCLGKYITALGENDLPLVEKKS